MSAASSMPWYIAPILDAVKTVLREMLSYVPSFPEERVVKIHDYGEKKKLR